MLLYRSAMTGDVRYRTELPPSDGRRADWALAFGQVHIRSLFDPSDPTPARRVPDGPAPKNMPGLVEFGPGVYPTLEDAREQFPQHAGLWDAVAKEHHSATGPVPGRESCTQGRTFTPEQREHWLSTLSAE